MVDVDPRCITHTRIPGVFRFCYRIGELLTDLKVVQLKTLGCGDESDDWYACNLRYPQVFKRSQGPGELEKNTKWPSTKHKVNLFSKGLTFTRLR